MSGYIGIDPSSTSTGLAVIGPRGGLQYTNHWERGKDGEVQDWLLSFQEWLRTELNIASVKAGTAAVEHLSVTQNMNTVRKISYFEGVALSSCAKHRLKVVHPKVTTVRKEVYGKGNLSKQEVYEINVERYGEGTFASHGKAALDVSDAVALAQFARLRSGGKG